MSMGWPFRSTPFIVFDQVTCVRSGPIGSDTLCDDATICERTTYKGYSNGGED